MQTPTKDTIIVTSPRTEFFKWVVAVLLAAMLVGAATMAYWFTVYGYSVTCHKSDLISCEVQRETFSDRHTWQVALGTQAVATVKIQPRRRGSARVLLFLNSGPQNFFAAEFEGGAAVAQAEAAAAQLNHVFFSSVPASVRVVARPPAYFTWLIWGGIGFLGMFVLVICRALSSQKGWSNNLSI
ncbi:MAG: hypothetical protein WBP13_08720 [Methylophilaceae bacterium]